MNIEDMHILVIDDSKDAHIIIRQYLEKAGFKNISQAYSANEAFEKLQMNAETNPKHPPFDLILLDVIMASMNGIEACKRIKSKTILNQIPILIMTADDSNETLEDAFNAGAMDFIQKPLRKTEFLARVGSALNIKQEMDERVNREQDLIKSTRDLKIANEVLQNLYIVDPLTNINNRGHFDMIYDQEWKRAKREKSPLSLMILDVDHFKLYNDTYGHQSGDNCLIRIADVISESMHRPGDFAARYGGEEFVVLLPNTESEGAVKVGESIRQAVLALNIEHKTSKTEKIVSISCGIATVIPDDSNAPEKLISSADLALYYAKRSGRNQVRARDEVPEGFDGE